MAAAARDARAAQTPRVPCSRHGARAPRWRATLLVASAVVVLHLAWLTGFEPREPGRPNLRAPLTVRIEFAEAADSAVAHDASPPPRAEPVPRTATVGRDARSASPAAARMRAMPPPNAAPPMAAPTATAPTTAAPTTAAPTTAAAPSPATAAPPASSDADLATREPSPVYPTRPPPSGRLHYELQRGAARGTAELVWQRDGDRYEARFDADVDELPWLRWTSRGRLDAAGIAPERFVDRRRGRGAQAANFDREAGRIGFSAARLDHALPPGAQDRLSWWLQLAAIAAADPAGLVPGRRLRVFVAGARGDADWWDFEVTGRAADDAPGGAATLHLVREPRRPYDTRAEVWLDPAHDWLPARLRLTQRDDGRDALELRRVGAPPAAPVARP